MDSAAVSALSPCLNSPQLHSVAWEL
jgi:hypothetical protein